ISQAVKVEHESTESFRNILEVNLVAPFRLSRMVGTHMVAAGRGSIVNIGSIIGVVGVGRMPQGSYAASKGGVTNLTRELAPMGRGGREGELDGALLFLASDASSYVTGSVLTVDGGWTAV